MCFRSPCLLYTTLFHSELEYQDDERQQRSNSMIICVIPPTNSAILPLLWLTYQVMSAWSEFFSYQRIVTRQTDTNISSDICQCRKHQERSANAVGLWRHACTFSLPGFRHVLLDLRSNLCRDLNEFWMSNRRWRGVFPTSSIPVLLISTEADKLQTFINSQRKLFPCWGFSTIFT